jgi:tetratricopeptide (TPR) repeat protein
MSPDEPATPLTPDRWREVEAIFLATRDREPGERATFLEQACGTDGALRHEVESLLAADHGATGFLEPPGVPVPEMQGLENALRTALAGRYALERELGRGGMATVYLADDVRHHRQVAIKVLHPELGAVLGAERFLREIGIAARLSHPHILPLHDSGTLDLGLGRPVLFYVMPYVTGRSLRERLREELQLPIPEALRIAGQVADALEHAHRQGVIHRDIKPENILLADGEAVLADFGIARALDVAGGDRLTETGLAIGTPAYMSPEQSAGSARLDGRSDIYALGCVLYEMLGGQPPFLGPTPQAILARHAMDPVPSLRTLRPTVPRALGQVVTQALAKVPADRFATAGEFARALDGAVSAAGPVDFGFRLRRLGLLLGVAAVVLALVVGLVTMRRTPGAATSNPKLVAVLPFRTMGANPELAWLREGLVDLLAIKLAGEGGLRAAEPSAILSAWRRVAGSEGQDIAPAAALEIAHHLGAGRVIDGSVVGTPAHLTITASLLTTPDGRDVARASVEGPADSLSTLLDRLAARLLSLGAGVDASRLSTITTSSLPAIRAYLAGRAAFRGGRLDEAFRQFREATLLDSTFALAALELVHASLWVTGLGGEDARRGGRLALAGRERLSPSDRALLDVWVNLRTTEPGEFQQWQAAVAAYPDRAELWYELGDTYYHYGLMAGLDDPLGLAAEAFQRGWAIDSASAGDSLAPEHSPIFAEPLTHMVEIAQAKGDTASVRRFVSLGLGTDSTSRQGWYLRWHRALALSDSARRAFWADSQRIDGPETFANIVGFTAWTGLASEDYLRAANLMIRRWAVTDPHRAALSRAFLAFNSGRPREAALMLNEIDDWMSSRAGRISEALYWGGDTAAAVEAAQRLAPSAAGTAVRGDAGLQRLVNLCSVATWRLARGDYWYAEAAIPRLRGVHVAGLSSGDSTVITDHSTLCAALLEATRATALHLPKARSDLEHADAAARSIVREAGIPANLVIARLAEAQGDLPLALRAVRRGLGGRLLPSARYLSTFLHEEGHLAALAGDTAGAIRAYHQYLALRPDPEPEVKPEVEQVRAELAKLLEEPRQ